MTRDTARRVDPHNAGWQELGRLGAVKLARPDDRMRAQHGGEWDWFFALSVADRRWLGRWFMVDKGITPDVLADSMGLGVDIDEAMRQWVAACRATRSLGGFAAVEEWAEQPETAPDVVVGASEACQLFGWKVGTFHKWQQRGRTPVPDMVVNNAPAWWASTLRDWAWDSGRGVEERVEEVEATW